MSLSHCRLADAECSSLYAALSLLTSIGAKEGHCFPGCPSLQSHCGHQAASSGCRYQPDTLEEGGAVCRLQAARSSLCYPNPMRKGRCLPATGASTQTLQEKEGGDRSPPAARRWPLPPLPLLHQGVACLPLCPPGYVRWVSMENGWECMRCHALDVMSVWIAC